MERSDREAETLRSYFVYEKYDNIYKFYESTQYQALEKRFKRAARMDVSKCFDSIYTHSLPWALYGKDRVKQNLKSGSYGEKFDSLMQKLNYNETNGILVGPEFSRLFAETILQSVDLASLRELERSGLRNHRDFELVRYVDDYFVFTNSQTVEDEVEQSIGRELRSFNLHLNMAKKLSEPTPTITPISIAKLKISRLLREQIRTKASVAAPGEPPAKKKTSPSRKLITEYKLILKETSVGPTEIANYVLSVAERRLVSALRRYARGASDAQSAENLVATLVATIEFCFFVYAGSPKVNPTVKLSRVLQHVVASLPNISLPPFARQEIRDLIYREIVHALETLEPTQHRQIENLYLLTTLRGLGAKYLLDEAFLKQYFSITEDSKGRDRYGYELGHFSAMTLLHYMGSRTRYTLLRNSVAKHLSERVKSLSENSAERSLLVLDSIACPHLNFAQQSAILKSAGYSDPTTISRMLKMDGEWFVSWNDFDLGRELDVKRNQEVY